LPEGLVEDDKVVKAKELHQFVEKELKKKDFFQQIYPTTLLIPESRVFSSSFLLPKYLKAEALKLEAIGNAQQEIPIPFEKANIVVSQGARGKEGVRTTVYATEKEIIQELLNSFTFEQFHLVALEANSKALFRLYLRYAIKEHRVKKAETLIGIVDVGHSWTTISLYTPEGSSVFSRTIVFHASSDTEKTFVLSKKTVDLFIETITEIVLYFKAQEVQIPLIVLGGVEAAEKEMLHACNEKSRDFVIKPISQLVKIPGVNTQEVHVFGAAIGAALRSTHRRKYSYQHNFIY